MQKIKEVLRLRFELGLGQRQIAQLRIGLRTVHDYLVRAAGAGIGWRLCDGLGEEELEAKLFGNAPGAQRASQETSRLPPGFPLDSLRLAQPGVRRISICQGS